MRTRLFVIFSIVTSFLFSSASYGQTQDLFSALTGCSNAVLVETSNGGCEFKPSTAKKSGKLRTVEQRLAAVDELLASGQGERLANAKNEEGQTPLHFALYTGDGPVFVDALLDAGADPNAALFDAPPLWHALAKSDANSSYNALTLLDYGADPNGKASTGETVLHCAASHNRFWVVRRLLEEGADPNAKFQGKTPEQLATDKTVKDLFKNWGKKPYPYSPYNKDEPALCKAASRNNYWAVKRLLAAGADKNASYQGKKAVEMTTDSKTRALLGGKGLCPLYLSPKRAEHVFRGEYDASNRHNAGGHSYSAYLYMKESGLNPRIHGLYENGVQLASVAKHTERRTADDPSRPGHTFYPSYWTKGDIFEAINALAASNPKEDKIESVYKGVYLTVILRAALKGNGRDIITSYPVLSRQPTMSGVTERISQAKDRVGAYR